MKLNSDALLLIKSIGLPDIKKVNVPLHKALHLLKVAKLNKVPLPFLESAVTLRAWPAYEKTLLQYQDRHKKTLNLSMVASRLLEESNVKYSIFKTLKPFKSTPADIDIVLYSTEELRKAAAVMKKSGFTKLDQDSYGSTFFSAEHQLGIDLTTEIAVSSFIYLNKTCIFNYTHRAKVDGFEVQTLNPSADLVGGCSPLYV